MKLRSVFLISLLVILLIASCTGEPPAPVDKPPIEVVNLQITPALSHWLPVIADCAKEISDFGIYTQVLPRKDLHLDEADLILRLGESLHTDPYIAIMGYEDIVVIVGEEVPIPSLSLESLQAIYAGSIVNWEAVPEIAEKGIEFDQPILILAYPAGHELRAMFREVFLQNEPISINSQPFSSIDYLETLLINNPHAIGFVLKSQIPEGSKILPIIDQDNPFSAQQYVLAITNEEPQSKLRHLLLCLQDFQ